MKFEDIKVGKIYKIGDHPKQRKVLYKDDKSLLVKILDNENYLDRWLYVYNDNFDKWVEVKPKTKVYVFTFMSNGVRQSTSSSSKENVTRWHQSLSFTRPSEIVEIEIDEP